MILEDLITINPAISYASPGNRVACPGNQIGELRATSYTCGTSNATALISRSAGICYDSLRHIFDEQAPQIDSELYDSVLLKAMLVHGCSWGEAGDRIFEVLHSDNNKQPHKFVRQWICYGIPQITRVLDCLDRRATLLGFGQLGNDQAHIFRLPLPSSLDSMAVWRRLTITLAWLSPIAANN